MASTLVGFSCSTMSTKGRPAPIGGSCRGSPTRMKRSTPFERVDRATRASPRSASTPRRRSLSSRRRLVLAGDVVGAGLARRSAPAEQGTARESARPRRVAICMRTRALPVGASSRTPPAAIDRLFDQHLQQSRLARACRADEDANRDAASSASIAAFSERARRSRSSSLPLRRPESPRRSSRPRPVDLDVVPHPATRFWTNVRTSCAAPRGVELVRGIRRRPSRLDGDPGREGSSTRSMRSPSTGQGRIERESADVADDGRLWLERVSLGRRHLERRDRKRPDSSPVGWASSSFVGASGWFSRTDRRREDTAIDRPDADRVPRYAVASRRPDTGSRRCVHPSSRASASRSSTMYTASPEPSSARSGQQLEELPPLRPLRSRIAFHLSRMSWSATPAHAATVRCIVHRPVHEWPRVFVVAKDRRKLESEDVAMLDAERGEERIRDPGDGPRSRHSSPRRSSIHCEHGRLESRHTPSRARALPGRPNRAAIAPSCVTCSPAYGEFCPRSPGASAVQARRSIEVVADCASEKLVVRAG